jgi:KDO2-lipid IV(A) lauroyltransferase
MTAIMLGLALLVPLRTASNAGSAIARRLGPLFHWHRRGMANLAYIYPEISQAERRKIMDGVWDNLGRTFGEFTRVAQVGETTTVSGLEYVPEAGTPIIFLTVHMANWEALSAMDRLTGRKIMVTYRRPNNVYVDKLLKLRTRNLPIEFVDKNDRTGIQLLRRLRAGGAVALLVDQRGSTGDLPVPFMGKDAVTVRTPAVLAAKTGATVIPVRMIRNNRHDLHIEISPPLPPITDTGPEAASAFMQQVNDIITGWIEDTPEQWLWIHRRWKNAGNQSGDTNAVDASVGAGTRQPSSV